MGRIDDFKEFIITELNLDFKTKRKLMGCESETQIIDFIPKDFNQLQKKFSEEWDKSYLFAQFTHTTDFIQVAKQVIHTQPLYYDNSKIWWIWNFPQSMWKKVDETDVLNMIDKHTKLPSTKSALRNELLEALKRVGRQNKPQEIKPTWVQFKHKIIDIETKKKFDADPKYFVTNPIPWDLGKSESTPVMDRIFAEWVGEDYVQTLYEIIAFSLVPSYPIHRLFCLIGSGMNGKSKYLELISKFVGTSNITTTELDNLLESRFELGRLHKKLVCLVGETNFSEMKKTSILKKLTGGDLIGFEYKGKDPFEDYNYAKIVISTNNLPTTTDKTIGFYRRWLIIDFLHRFDEKKDILNDIPEKEYSNLAKKSVKVLRKLLSNRVFHNEGNVEERMKKFEDLSNPLDKFMKENIEESMDEEIFKYEFRKRLDDWCEENRFRKITDHFLGRKMKELHVETGRKTAEWFTKEGNKPFLRTWCGLQWKNTGTIPALPAYPSSSYQPYSSKASGTKVDVVDKVENVTSVSNGTCQDCDLKNVELNDKGQCEYCGGEKNE
tara:strand:+ start:1268 stop:2920 length:1653 start_codon:yes stop_codon:yes gene_type:complete